MKIWMDEDRKTLTPKASSALRAMFADGKSDVFLWNWFKVSRTELLQMRRAAGLKRKTRQPAQMTDTVLVRLPEGIATELRAEAAKRGVTLSVVIRDRLTPSVP